jgi:hypothetical protein
MRALRGLDVAEELAEVARELVTHSDVQAASNLAATEAMAAFAAGDLAEARRLWQRSGILMSGQSPVMLARAARAALWARDPAGALEDLAALEATRFHGPSVDADRSTMRAGVAALEERSGEALSSYREALHAWRDLGLAWDEALCGVDMALFLDASDPLVRAAADVSRATLTRLEAAPILARLEARMGGSAPAASTPVANERLVTDPTRA